MLYHLTDAQKRQCMKYAYHESNSSIHEKWMKPVWDRVESYIPDYICATTITSIGLVANLVPCILLMTLAPTAEETVPSLFLLWCCLGMFIHQNLDNMDGRHARRFGVENPITDFFDHTADVITAGITVINVSIATKLGNFPEWMICFVLIFLVVFYSYHWQVYNSALVKFGMFDVTESQDVAILFVLVSAAAGQDIWSVQIHVLENQSVDVRKICLVMACLGGILKVIQNLVSICNSSFKQSVKLTTSKWLELLFPAWPIICNVLCLYFACCASPVFYLQYPVLLSATITIMIAKPILEIMIAHFTHSTMAALTLNEVAMVMFLVNANVSLVDIKQSLVILLLFGCLDFGIYFYGIQSDMHDCMGFKWFQLTTHGKVEQRHHEVKVKPIVKERKEASGKERKEVKS